MAQNYGAGNRERVMKSYKICLIYSFSIAFVLGLFLRFFGTSFLMLFTREPVSYTHLDVYKRQPLP